MTDKDKRIVEFCEFPTTYLGNPAKKEMDELCRIIRDLEEENRKLLADLEKASNALLIGFGRTHQWVITEESARFLDEPMRRIREVLETALKEMG